ncbi:peptide transporter family 1-like [Lycorma delicatula]|uniref:peptide transporter family 1-like n=1 Tax=Lycorma delicatula TaxID=130591 RepID=UPI003F516640
MSYEEGTIKVSKTREHKLEYKYPKAVFFIVSNEFCERFSYYGMRSILPVYLHSVLQYSANDTTVIYHAFTMFCYFFPLLGAIMADSVLGKFRTILYLSVVFAIGNTILSVASTPGFSLSQRGMSLVGMMFIAIGTGGIKPCVSAFGGDQFMLPQQEKQLQQFFSIFYFTLNAGGLISTLLIPWLRRDFSCFGEDFCFPLAFGAPAVLMILALCVFGICKNIYVIKKPQENIVLRVICCITYAVKKRIASKDKNKEHWLDFAEDKFDKTLIEETKALLQVMFLYLPLPVFWALFDQQGSRWTFQATNMDGTLGWYTLKPEQMQVMNPLLILVFIPLFESVLYPLLARCQLLTRPLQKLSAGGILAAVAFFISALVELRLQGSYAVVPHMGESQLRIFNGLNCSVNLESVVTGENKLQLFAEVETLQAFQSLHLPASSLTVTATANSSQCPGLLPWTGNITTIDARAVSYFIMKNDDEEYEPGNIIVEKIPGFDNVHKSEIGISLQNKWRNIKDSYNREKRRLSGVKSSSAAARKTPYVYFNLLSFLNSTNQPTTTHSSLEPDPQDSDNSQDTPAGPYQTRVLARKRKPRDEAGEKLVEVLKESSEAKINLERELLNDEDRLFMIVLYKLSADRGNLKITDDEKTATIVLTKSDIYTPQKEIPGLVGSFRIYIGGTEIHVRNGHDNHNDDDDDDDIEMGSGGVYTLVIHENKTHISGNLVTISPPNKVHMLWLFPQYAVMTVAEIMFVVTGIEFSFTQAPGSMKSVLSASWLLTVAFGNLIVVIISHAKFFKNLADEFFLFVVLMLIDMAVFIIMASRYHYAPTAHTDCEISLQKLG